MKSWAIGFIVGSFLCLASVFVYVGIKMSPGLEPIVVAETENSGSPNASAPETSSETAQQPEEQEAQSKVAEAPAEVETKTGSEPEETASNTVEETVPEPDVVVEVEPQENEVAEAAPAEEIETPTVVEELPAQEEAEATKEASVAPSEEETAKETEVVQKEEEDEPSTPPSSEPEQSDEEPKETEVAVSETPTATPANSQVKRVKVGSSGASKLPSISTETDAQTEEIETTEPELVDTRPKLAVVLRLKEEDNGDYDGISNLGIPITFAISPARDDAENLAAGAARVGHEIFVLSPQDVQLSLSGNLSDAQVSTLLERYFLLIPNATGFLDRDLGTLQKDRELAKSVLSNFAEKKRTLLTYRQGLNSILRSAEAAEVKAGLVFRQLDAKNEKPSEILRTLDRAALEAAQSGAAIVESTASIQAIQAIKEWSTSQRANSVSFATVTQVLNR